MSYDLRIAVKDERGSFIVVDEPELSSPTYNLGKMFRACTGWDFTQGEFYRVSEVMPLIERGILELSNNRNEYVKYNSPNGWGTIEGALRALESLHDKICDMCSEYNGTWNEYDEEHLYVAW